MIIRLVLLLMLLSISRWSVSQSSVILTDGKEIPYKKVKTGNSELVLTLQNGEKKEIPFRSIYAINDFDMGEFLYNKSNSFVPIETEGMINLYKNSINSSFTTGGPNNTSYSYQKNIYLYAEKHSAFENLFVTNAIGQNKGEKKEILKRFVSDDSESEAIIQSDDFKCNIGNIIQLVERYNLSKIEKHVNPKTTDSTKVIFFRSNTSYNSILYLDNGLEYSFDTDNKIVVKLPQRSLYRVCLDSSKTSCSIIRTEPFIKFYSIETDKKGNQSIKVSTVKSAGYSVRHLKYTLNPAD